MWWVSTYRRSCWLATAVSDMIGLFLSGKENLLVCEELLMLLPCPGR
jgi:hypothetical protein